MFRHMCPYFYVSLYLSPSLSQSPICISVSVHWHVSDAGFWAAWLSRRIVSSSCARVIADECLSVHYENLDVCLRPDV